MPPRRYDWLTGERLDDAGIRAKKRRLERETRRALRALKVTPITGLLSEVLAAESRSCGADAARAYLVALARRVVGEYIAERPADLQQFCATRLANHVERVEKRAGFVLPPEAAPMLAMKKPRPPRALPPRTVEALPAAEPLALPPAQAAGPSLFDDIAAD
jgi:hypothetical protein